MNARPPPLFTKAVAAPRYSGPNNRRVQHQQGDRRVLAVDAQGVDLTTHAESRRPESDPCAAVPFVAIATATPTHTTHLSLTKDTAPSTHWSQANDHRAMLVPVHITHPVPMSRHRPVAHSAHHFHRLGDFGE